MSAQINNIRSFIQCWKEVIEISNNISSRDKETVIKTSLSHFKNLDNLAKIFNLNPKKSTDHQQIRRLSEVISKSGAYNNFDDIYAVVNDVHRKITEDGELLSFLSEDDRLNSITKIRISLIKSSFEIYKICKLFNDDKYKEHITKHFSLSISLSQDIAFNWGANTTYHDREIIFCEILPMCSEIIINNWIDAIYNYSEIYEPNESSIKPLLEQFDQAVEENSMGYSDDEVLDKKWITEKVIDRIITDSNLTNIGRENYKIRSVITSVRIRNLCDSMAYAWNEAANEIFDRIDRMDDEEYETFVNSKEANEPMSIDHLFKHYNLIKNESNTPTPIKIDVEGFENSCRSEFTLVWGISNSLFKNGSEG